ncbi:lariat debranching enzyme [Pestalotiopsis sp. IQ-011]
MATEPRVKFHYNNMMYAVAGYLVEKLSGVTLSAFFHEYLWEPMHLNETFVGLYDSALNATGLVVADEYYYNKLADEYVRVDHPDVSPDEGAGAVVSNVLDYAKYLRVMMDEGAPLSKAGHRELRTSRSFYQPSGPPFVGPMTYTLGWMSGIFQGEQIWLHSGQVNMFMTWMLMVPSRGFGITVMTNTASKAMTLVLYRILCDLFDVEENDRFDFAAQYGRSPKAE